VLGRSESEKGQSLPPLVCVEPTQIPIAGILSARALSRVRSGAPEPSQVTSQDDHTVTSASNNRAYCMIANFSEEALIIPRAIVLGIAEQIPDPLVARINARSHKNSDPPMKPRRKRKNEALYHKLLQGKLDHLLQEEKNLIEPVLVKYAHVFHDDETNDFRGMDMVEHQILVENVQPMAPVPNPVRFKK